MTKRIGDIPARLFPICLTLLFSYSSAFSEITLRPDLTLVSRYIWRGFDTIADDRPAIQPSLTLNFGTTGIWLNLWSAVAMADTDFVELDLVMGWDKALFNRVNFSAGAGYFTFPSLPHYPDRNSTTPEIYVGISDIFLPLSPAFTLYYDFNLGDGIYATLSFNPCFRLRGKTFEKVFRSIIQIGYTTQYRKIKVESGFSDIHLGISTEFNFKSMILTPSINYVIVPNQSINDENEFWVGLMISRSANGSTD